MHDNISANLRTPEQIIQAIFALDLEVVKQLLRDKEDGEGWTTDQANYYEMEYKQFLALSVKYPEADISPSRNVDAFWHAHILNTRKYARDCENTFGYFVHHEPGLRDGSAEEKSRYENSFQLFSTLKQREFSVMDTAEATAAEGAYCGLSSPLQADKAAYCGLSENVRLSNAAYCGRGPARQPVNAAYCGLSKNAQGNEAAYCGLSAPEKKAGAAYCGLSKPKAAYCGLSVQGGAEEAAYCGLQSPAEKSQVAYCGLSSPDTRVAAYCGLSHSRDGEIVAYCGLQSLVKSEQAAYCGLTVSEGNEKAAYCGRSAAKAEEETAYCGLALHGVTSPQQVN